MLSFRVVSWYISFKCNFIRLESYLSGNFMSGCAPSTACVRAPVQVWDGVGRPTQGEAEGANLWGDGGVLKPAANPRDGRAGSSGGRRHAYADKLSHTRSHTCPMVALCPGYFGPPHVVPCALQEPWPAESQQESRDEECSGDHPSLFFVIYLLRLILLADHPRFSSLFWTKSTVEMQSRCQTSVCSNGFGAIFRRPLQSFGPRS